MQKIPPHSQFDQSVTYQITVKGRLDPSWTEWFDGLIVALKEEKGKVSTTLTGPVPDQSSLHGLLARIRDLGLTLLEIHQLETGSDPNPTSSEDKK
ncbi:MAG: hypothetical protein ABSF99_03945 [Anaerolineales bacterium]|jgi:hypothetical protein